MRISLMIFATLATCAIAAKNTTVTKLYPASKTGKPGESRGKRTLYSVGNYGYNPTDYPNHNHQAQRRISTYNQNYYQQDPYSGQFGGPPNNYIPDASNHLVDQPQPYYHPQYIEPPEPIIEIIIKESNESIPELPQQPHFIKKKKKEQVQVYYVNYKKGHNNKLQLENPIPALTPAGFNNEHEEEEETQIIHPVTPLPKLRTTTLRTIIHPESEKFHSNSGVHVSFNVEDKYQDGHQLQEHNEGSEIKSVVAIPNSRVPPNHRETYSNQDYQNRQQYSHHQNNYNHENYQNRHNYQSHQNYQQQAPQNHQFNHRFQSHYRGDYSRAQQTFNNEYRPQNHQTQATHLHPLPNSFHQQPPSNTQPSPYRTFSSQQNNQNGFRQNGYHSQQPLTHLTPRSPPFIPQQTTPAFQLPYRHPAPQFNRIPPPPPPPSGSSQYSHQKQHSQFPSGGGFKTNIKSHVNYQPLKYRQQSNGPHKPIPIPIHSIPPDSREQTYNRPISFGPPSPAPPPQFTLQTTENHAPSPHFRPRPTQQINYPPLENNRPHNSNPPSNTHLRPLPHQVQHHSQQFGSQQLNFHQNHQNKFFPPGPTAAPEAEHFENNLSPNPEGHFNNLNIPFLGNVHSELVKSVPRFEQHITETITDNPTQFGANFNGHQQQQQQQQQQQYYKEFASQNTQSSAIQTVPSPNLGPTTPESPIQHHSSTSGFRQSSTPSHSLNNYVSQQHHSFGSSTANSIFTGVSSTPSPQYTQNGEHLQIVTPVPSNQYNQQSYSDFSQNNVNPQIIPNSQPLPQSQAQRAPQPLPPPGQSVSTIHTEALKELERLKNSYNAQNHQYDQQNNQDYSQQVASQSGPAFNQQFSSPNNNEYRHHSFNQQQNHQQQNHQQQNHQQQNHQQFNDIASRNQYSEHQSNAQTTSFAFNHRYPSTTAETTTQTTTTTEATTPTTPSQKSNPNPNINLPDEVPEDLRQQLLTSGILDNADISVLDYDKIGDTALENLPPEHLAHFYGAGGASQISGSSKVLSVVKPNGEKVNVNDKRNGKIKEFQTLPKRENVDLKVVRFDSTNQKSITDKYIRSDATVLPAVDLNNSKYNRYLPLKVNGAHFPIPDAQELRGKLVSSVVVLAPVDPQQGVDDDSTSIESRHERGLPESKRIKFIAGDSLKTLLKKPTRENFKRWLEKESRTDIDFQSVVLLVTKNKNENQEIFMYDIATKEVNKLSGALSSAFVNVAEENASSQDIDNASISDSGIVERMVPERKDDYVAEASEIKPTVVKYSSRIQSRHDDEHKPVYISSGYSVIRK